MLVVQYAVLVIIIFGHLALWIAFFNRTHGFNLPGRWIRCIELMQILAANGLLLLIIERYVRHMIPGSINWELGADSRWLLPYSVISIAFGIRTVIHWCLRAWHDRHPPNLVALESKLIRIGQQLDRVPVRGWSTRLFACLPTNQMFDLCVNEKAIVIDRLPAELDGLTITHLSDLHFTGKITLPFFQHVIDHAITLDGDIIAITGDILEQERCYEWLPATLARLRARHGIFFVLGNHDRRLKDLGRLRRELTSLGMIDLAHSPYEFQLHGRQVLLAGNELPWSRTAVEPPLRAPQPSLRVLLSHTPDQLPWARERDFDLMLAGHTHGGHIRLPFVGPIVCPSRHGVKFAGGIFFEPPTLMHVSRGISGLDPLRFNCPPEITKLVLRRKFS